MHWYRNFLNVITFEIIDKALFNANAIQSGKNFVAVAAFVDEKGQAFHSGLVIKYKEKAILFHYTGQVVSLANLPHTTFKIFHKELPFILEDEVAAFYVHCTQIQKHAQPKYGFFYAGDYYDVDGKFFSSSTMPEYMTCVGFCINVVKGYLENHDYFVHEDWDESSYADPNYDGPADYFQEFLEIVKRDNPHEKIDEALFRKNLRRITPSEYTTSAFLSQLPVRKEHTDPILDSVKRALKQKVLGIPPRQQKSA